MKRNRTSATHARTGNGAQSGPKAATNGRKSGYRSSLDTLGTQAPNGKGRLYSYTRFSSPEQAKGDSERRQLEAAQRFAQDKGLVLDDSLRMVDRGLSGFHGTHRRLGAFGAFLEKVTSGQVPRGSILLVENIDRLGREPVLTAMETVLALLKHGITIQTLSPPDSFTTASVNDGGFWRLVAHIERAHAESKRKSDLAHANWKQKRKLAPEKILTRRAPAWLRFADGQFHLIPEAAKTVQLIFKLKLDGFGKTAIERKLNQEAPWTPPKNPKRRSSGWRYSYIEKILKSRAVLGEFQPHQRKDGKRVPEGEAIAGYFPKVIEPKTWHRLQARMASNGRVKGNGGGRTGKATNLFQNLVRCGYCGGAMVFVDKGPTNKGGKYLFCDNGRRGVLDEHGKRKCRRHYVRYDELEETLLGNLPRLRPETVLPNVDETTERAAQLRNLIAGIVGELSDTERKIENFIDQVGATADRAIRERYEKRIADLQTKLAELQAEKVNKETALHEVERGGQSFDKWQKDLSGLQKAIAKDIDTRIKLRTHLKEFLAKVEVFGIGHADEVEHAEAMLEDSDIERAASFPAFRRYLRKRLLSPDARCYKVHLRTARKDSTGFQVAPVASLAGGITVQPGERQFSGPKLAKLGKEFFDARKPGFVPKASAV